MTLGAPFVFGSNRSARAPFTFNSSGWLSVVPKKFTPAVVPLLPPKSHAAAAAPAFVQARLVPLYAST